MIILNLSLNKLIFKKNESMNLIFNWIDATD